MKQLTTVALLAACSFHPHGASSDASTDAGIDAPSGSDAADPGPCVTWDAVNVSPCDASLGILAIVSIGSGTFVLDTDVGELVGGSVTTLPGALIDQTSGPELRVVNASELEIASAAMVTVTGAHPLVIAVHGDATIDGTLDVSARFKRRRHEHARSRRG
jgi:hypothetical protein